MIEWTGERFVPWLRQSEIAYEHLHRYALAQGCARGKRVLDLASGEGYGTALLAEVATHATGVDIDADAVRHAAGRYTGPNITFLEGSAAAVPITEDHVFDLIVCFEAIEHIEDQVGLVREVQRLLRPGGLFIVSTPNKRIYSDHASGHNPYHVHELDIDEFRALLAPHFPTVRMLGQGIRTGSMIWPLDGSAETSSAIGLSLTPDGFRLTREVTHPEAMYFIAMASSTEVAVSSSHLVDASASWIADQLAENQRLRRTIAEQQDSLLSQETALAWRATQMASLEESLRSMQSSLDWLESQAHQLRDTIASHEAAMSWLESQNQSKDATIQSQTEALTWRAEQVDGLESTKRWLLSELTNARNELSTIYNSRGWKLLERLRSLRPSR